MKRVRNWLMALSVLMLATGCGGGSSSSSDSSSGTTSVRVANITTAGNLVVTGTYTSSSSSSSSTATATIASGVASGAVSGYASLTATTYSIQASVADGSLSTSAVQSVGAAKDTNYTIVAYQRPASVDSTSGALSTLVLTDNQSAASSGYTLLSVYNVASDAGSLDVYLVPHGASVSNYSASFTSVAAGSSSLNQSVNSGTFDIVVTAASKPDDIRLTMQSVPLVSTEVASLIFTGTAGGALVNGALIQQGGSVLVMQQSDKARVRVAGGFGSDGSLVTTTLSGGVSLGSLTSPSVNNYALVPANSTIASMSLTTGANVLSIGALPTTAFVGGGDYTILVSGSTTAPVVSVLKDNNQAPTSSAAAKMRLVNAAVATTAGGLSLTDNYVQLVSNLAYGAASSYVGVSTGSSQLTISSPLATFPSYTIKDSNGTFPYVTAGNVYTIFALQAGSTLNNTTSVILLSKDR